MSNKGRLFTIWSLLVVAVAGLIWRLVDLNIINRPFLLQQSQARILRKITVPAYRGMILDRLGSPLAVSTPVDSAWINPPLFNPTAAQLSALAKIIKLPTTFIQHRTKDKKRQFIYLKRELSPNLSEALKKLNIKGLFFQREYKRFYPEGKISSHVVGLTNIDDQGQEGLELAYNKWLGGVDGKREVLKDRLGHIIANVALLKKPEQGHDLTLSIDHRLQYLAFEALDEALKSEKADSGSVVVLNAQTGEILAMANLPSYNPNNRPKNHDGRYRNRALTDMFEPGSVMKPFTVAEALKSGQYNLKTNINTNPGWMRIGGYTIRDDLNYGVVTLTTLLQKSSNIAAAKIMLSLKPQPYWHLLQRFGFGMRTRSGFPGESAGLLVSHTDWVPSVVATLAYGYGISVTTLQLAHAYMILADGGVNRPVTFLKLAAAPSPGIQVIPEKIANEIIKMLCTVVEKGGTGTRAAIPGYRVAGKTGTAYIARAKGYYKDRYISSFVGIAPATHPQFVVAVAIRNPRENHFGGLVAAPVFKKVMSGALRLYDIAPD